MDGLIPTAVRGQLARPTYQRSFMRTLSMLAAIAAVFTFVSFSAQAIPAASLKGATNSDQTITQVRGGCGLGWHRWRGRCVRNR